MFYKYDGFVKIYSHLGGKSYILNFHSSFCFYIIFVLLSWWRGKGIVNFRVTDDSILNVNIKFLISQSSHPEVFLENGVIKISGKFTEEHLCRSVISIKLLCDLLHIFRTAFTKNTSGWLLLYQRHISENTILLHIISKKCFRNECIFTGTPCKNQLLFSGFKRYFV